MSAKSQVAYASLRLSGSALLVAMSLATTGANSAACTGPGAPTTTQTKCIGAVQIPGNPLRSFDISWVNPDRAEYYLGDRANAGIDVIDTRTLPSSVPLVVLSVSCRETHTAGEQQHLRPDGVTSHGRWLYAGDGDSTLHVIDLDAPPAAATKRSSAPAGLRGSTRWH